MVFNSLRFNGKMKAFDLWKIVASAENSDQIMVELKKMMHELFDAEYVIVFISPSLPLQRTGAPADVRVDFVQAKPDVELPEPVQKTLEINGHRYVSADEVTREILNEFIRLGGMDIEGYDEIILNFVLENRYLGFISLHRKEKFSRSEKRKIAMLKPYLMLAMRLAVSLSLIEEMPVYAFNYIVNNLVTRYRLTPTEEFVVKRLVQGKDLKEIAFERKTTIYAIRKIVRSIYRKVGVQRRAELLSKIFPQPLNIV